jgi:predicted enzyme related to lactoylglutathione lyase
LIVWHELYASDVERAKSLGAELHHGPASVEDMLRFAALGDPGHATFGVMSSAEAPVSGIVGWNELQAGDVDTAARFYGEVFGWTTAAFAEGYQLFNAGETAVGGLMPKPAESPVSAWTVYFSVGNVDDSTARAAELGASVMLEPTSMENVGRFSVASDPIGAVFGLHAGE